MPVSMGSSTFNPMSTKVYEGTPITNISFKKETYIKRKLDHDYVYIFEVNDEYPNDRKFKIIWESSGIVSIIFKAKKEI